MTRTEALARIDAAAVQLKTTLLMYGDSARLTPGESNEAIGHVAAVLRIVENAAARTPIVGTLCADCFRAQHPGEYTLADPETRGKCQGSCGRTGTHYLYSTDHRRPEAASMKWNLTKPCAKCPFRNDIPGYLTKGRVADLERGLEHGTFMCHSTLDYDNPVDEEGDEPSETKKSAHCAGALILLEKEGRPSQMMRIAERLNSDGQGYNPEKLDMDAPVYDSFKAMKKAMPR